MAVKVNAALAKRVLEVVDEGLCSGLGQPKPGQMCVEAAVCYAMRLPHGDKPTCVSPALRSLKIVLNDAAWSSNDSRAKGMRRLAIAQLGSAGAVDDTLFRQNTAKMVIKTVLPRALRHVAIVSSNVNRQALEAAALRCETEGTSGAALEASDAAKAASETSSDAAKAASEAADRAAARAAWAAIEAASASWVASDEATEAAGAASAVRSAASAVRSAAWAASNEAAAWTAWSVIDEATEAAGDQILSEFAEAVVQILIEMKAPGCQWLHLTE